jgi:adenosylcobyric acid synthase
MKKKATALMVQGTGSGVGKSILTAALARYFYKRGINVAPFKAQNMALNSFVTLDGLEMGRAQVYQAEACGLEPDVRMNPILLKPSAENQSQVILLGKSKGNKKAREYYADFQEHWEIARNAYDSLASEFDLLVLEGAGSPAEINLQATDLVNMRMAEHAGAAVLIVGDIDKGGVFAWMKGTFDLLREEHKGLVKGFIINKFRGDRTLLEPGIKMFQDMVNRPVVGVAPYQREIWVDEEDSQSLNFSRATGRGKRVRIGVIHLPRISNFTDFSPLALEKDVSLFYLKDPWEMEDCDCVILPGSKSTLSDAQYLFEQGWFGKIMEFKEGGGTIVGVCGGYQMLGQTISDPEGVEGELQKVRGLGLLPMETEFRTDKILKRVCYKVIRKGFFEDAREEELGDVFGYEIHMGRTEIRGEVHRFLEADDPSVAVSSKDGSVLGSYIHGLFDSDLFRWAFINRLRDKKGMEPIRNRLLYKEFREEQLDKLEKLVEDHLDMDLISRWLD